MSNLRAEQISIVPLNCTDKGITCPMAVQGSICTEVAIAMQTAATKEDPTYESEGRLPLSQEAALLADHFKLGSVVKAAGRTACLKQQAKHNETAAQSLTYSIYS